MVKKYVFVFTLIIIINLPLTAQTHISVPLENPVYAVIELAQIRGLCGYLPSTKPYSRAMILGIIEEILANEPGREFTRLKETERNILEQFRKDFNPDRKGFNLINGTLSSEHTWHNIYFSYVFGFGFDLAFGAGFYPVAAGYRYKEGDDPLFEGAAHPASGDFFMDYSITPGISLIGDLGKSASYGFALTGFVGKSPRTILGRYETTPYDPEDDETHYQLFPVRSEPLAYFPYTYKKKWDAFVFPASDVGNSSMMAWPEGHSLGYSMMVELSGAFLNGRIMYRFARLDREWSSPINNGSLVLNQSAQPFLALETVITPFKWFSISALTGILEFNNAIGSNNNAGTKDSSATFQNAFSIVMLELSYKNYFKAGLGSSVVWPKRFELGYLFPLVENYLYQNNIGDYDNVGLFLNLEAQYPLGFGKAWFSVFIDEISFESSISNKDRTMYAYQLGSSFYVPWLPFASITLSYTKIEPYNYTHSRKETPWYGNNLMETNYVSFGKPLGYYLPPNSDEIMVRFQTLPIPKTLVHLQYQMIRHGADYGDRAVDGSSLWSELKSKDRSSMKKYFLHDGAYKWTHILKVGGEYSLTGRKLPIKIIGEFGMVYSYFTDTDGELGTSAGMSVINTPQYPHSLALIGFVGIQFFPKY